MWRILQQDAPEDFVVATGRLSSLEEFVAAAFGEAGLDWRDHEVSDPALMRPTDLAGFAGNPARAVSKLGWSARTCMPEVAIALVRAELASLRTVHP
jgi:GDPmannose 4,6-dehydratase